MHGRHHPLLVVSALVGLVCLVGCGQARAAAPTTTATHTLATATVPQQFTSLHVLRTSASPDNHIPAFEATTTDVAKIQHLYATLRALPAWDKGAFCPDSTGVHYHLTFSAAGINPVYVIIEVGGCQVVSFEGMNRPLQWLLQTPQFWPEFAATLGVPESALRDISPRPTGPYAPTLGP